MHRIVSVPNTVPTVKIERLPNLHIGGRSCLARAKPVPVTVTIVPPSESPDEGYIEERDDRSTVEIVVGAELWEAKYKRRLALSKEAKVIFEPVMRVDEIWSFDFENENRPR